jgi:muramidase (phage lysozyme)
MLNEKAASHIEHALCYLSGEWRSLTGVEKRAEEITRQYNQLLNILLDLGWDAYADDLDITCMLPEELMSKRYLVAAKREIPPNHAGYE